MTQEDEIVIAAAPIIERFLRSLLKGKLSSVHLSFNDWSSANYATVKQFEDSQEAGDPGFRHWTEFGSWVSDDERAMGHAKNSKWMLNLYARSTDHCQRMAASSLSALMAAAIKEFGPK